MKIRELLTEGAERLAAAGIDEPRREAGTILAFALGRDRTYLITDPDAEPTEDGLRAFEAALSKRAARVPFQHIRGSQEFYGLDFEVDANVLIPRPETEFAVEAAIDALHGLDLPVFAEVGVGSGCIAVSILHNVTGATAVGLEISDTAIGIARANALRHGVSARLELRSSDVFSALAEDESFDLIVSNPPYIPLVEIESLQPEVREHDPLIALTDGLDGLSVISRIVNDAPKHLNPRGTLVMEIGHGQRDAVESLFDASVWHRPVFIEDLRSIPRTVVAKTV
jgi:release factor glutamine methyltransferase